jgi:uncharacterized phage-associated protein
MVITFEFDARKAVHAMAYLVSRLEGRKTDKVKLMKLLYLADRDHFLQEGRPITGDDQYAMPFGPVPTLSLDLLDGQFAQDDDGGVFTYLQTRNYEVSLKELPEPSGLSPSEIRALDAVIQQFGSMDTWRLKDYTHQLPEYRQVFRPGTSTRIPFELLLQLYSSGNLYRHERPVITSGMAANMSCPFPRSEADL